MHRSARLAHLPFVLLPVLPLVLVACGDEYVVPPLPDASLADASSPGDAASIETGLSDGGVTDGAAGDANVDVAPPPAQLGIVVIHSDYTTSSVSLLSRSGAVERGDCLHSGKADVKLTAALSGDIALPSSAPATREVVIIDRTTGVLTFLDGSTCGVNRQVNVSTGFKANPYDVAVVAPDRAYVTRYGHNMSPTANAADFDEGSDVLLVNPTTGAITGRIDLLPWAVPGAGGAVIYPSADQILPFENKLYVSLNNLSANFMAASHGRVVIIDPQTNTVEGAIDLPTLKNCSELQPAGPHTLVLACGGAFSDGPSAINHAGVARIDTQTRAVTSTVPSTMFGNRTVFLYSLASTSAGRFFTVTPGDFSAAKDQLWTAAFDGMAPVSFLTGAGAFNFGPLLLDEANARLFMTDGSATQPQVRVYDIAVTPAAPLPGIATSPTLKLPPRGIGWYERL